MAFRSAVSMHRHFLFALLGGMGVLFVFFYGVLGSGLPVLRHDWSVPPNRAAAFHWVTQAFAGWQTAGIGHPNVYPINYVAGVALAPITFFTGGLGEVVCILALTALGAFACTRALGAGNNFELVAFSAILLLNPWSYNELVAGHLYMPLACYGFFALWKELRLPMIRPAYAFLFFLAAMQQMQFLLPAVLITALTVRRTREFAVYAIAVGALLLPVIFGIAAHFGTLQAIPNLSLWEASQSVPFSSALRLMGYGPHYAAGYHLVSVPAGILFAIAGITALSAAPVARWKAGRGLAAVIVVALIASGTTGPTARAMGWIFANVHAAGVYRELYDLVGVIAVAWVYVLVQARHRLAVGAVCTAGILASFAVGWCVHFPKSYFVPASRLPTLRYDVNKGQRVALMPPFQPFSLNRRGAGLDPYAIGDDSVINSPFPTYPVSGALAQAWLRKDYSTLSALGVAAVVNRPDMRSRILKQQYVASTEHRQPPVAAGVSVSYPQSPIPVLSTLTAVELESLPGKFGSNAISVAEPCRIQKRLLRRCRHYAVDNIVVRDAVVDPSNGWVPINTLAYVAPEFANVPAGYFTRSHVRLPLREAHALLASINGSLKNEAGKTISNDTHGFRWIPIDAASQAVACWGECTVIATSPQTVPDISAKIRASKPISQVAYSRPVDWLLVLSRNPSDAPAILRFASQFDPYWIAIAPHNGRLPHFRLDYAINGWALPPHANRVYLLNVVAAITEVLEAIGLLVSIVALFSCRRRPPANS